jgi:hypothetical protein
VFQAVATGAATDYNKATQGRKNEKKVTLSLPADDVIAIQRMAAGGG